MLLVLREIIFEVIHGIKERTTPLLIEYVGVGLAFIVKEWRLMFLLCSNLFLYDLF